MEYDFLTLIEKKLDYSWVKCKCGRTVEKRNSYLNNPSVKYKACGLCDLDTRKPESERTSEEIAYLKKIKVRGLKAFREKRKILKKEKMNKMIRLVLFTPK